MLGRLPWLLSGLIAFSAAGNTAALPGDLNADGRVDAADLLILSQHWLREATPTSTPTGTLTPTATWTPTPSPTPAPGTASLSGVVRDAQTLERLWGVLVELVQDASRYQTLTLDGSYLIQNVPLGSYQFSAGKLPEYQKLEFPLALGADPPPVNVTLNPLFTRTATPTSTPTVLVTPTPTPTATSTGASTPTPTPTPTWTGTPTPTRTPTRTPTPTPAVLALGTGAFRTLDEAPVERNGVSTGNRLTFVFQPSGAATAQLGSPAAPLYTGTYLYTWQSGQPGALAFVGSTESQAATLTLESGQGLPLGGPYPQPESLLVVFSLSSDPGAVYSAQAWRVAE